MIATALTASALRPHLERCGYRGALLRSRYAFGTSAEELEAALAGFAHEPTDARSACLVAIDDGQASARSVARYRELGAPIVFICREEGLEWWRQGPKEPQLLETVRGAEVPGFFERHNEEFAPERVYRAKTVGQFEAAYQLSFVDVGLVPLVEGEIGQRLSDLVTRVVRDLVTELAHGKPTEAFAHWLFKSVFWLLAARILRDKQVPAFLSLDLSDIETVFDQVARHYGSSSPLSVRKRAERDALSHAAQEISRVGHLGHVTTESLAYVYENTLISKALRRELGIHSTPPYLVDYIVWRLASWIEEIPAEDRQVLEPAGGHAAFLVSAMRLLREGFRYTSRAETPQRYLRERLHGIERDPFAVEIARLSLTLADIPNPDGWDLQVGDMFSGDILQREATRATILLSNPPFENFSPSEMAQYRRQGNSVVHNNKVAEVLRRTLPHLRANAVFGVVVPQGLLHSANAASLRELLATQFELAEICLFPDKIFAFSDMESAVILGRRHRAIGNVRYRRVREPDAIRFKECYAATTDRLVPQTRFLQNHAWSMQLPDLEEVWSWCRRGWKLDELAIIGKGLEYKGAESLPSGSRTISKQRFPGPRVVRGYATVDRRLLLHARPIEVWMSLDPTVIRRRGTGTTVGTAQVLLNYARVGRGPWRLKAVIDRRGHAVTSRFLTVRPKSTAWSLEFLWALCNSPVANAYVYTHTMKRDILPDTMRSMPVPVVSEADAQRIQQAASAYLVAVTPAREILPPGFDEAAAENLLKRVDAEVLRLYDLPPSP